MKIRYDVRFSDVGYVGTNNINGQIKSKQRDKKIIKSFFT
jgi:hypothetical protein